MSELTTTGSGHAVKVKDVQIGSNKNKFMFVLWSSKTHSKASKPQLVKITRTPRQESSMTPHRNNSNLLLPCPYQLLRQYVSGRKPYSNDNEQFFVFRDGSPVKAVQLRNCLKNVLKSAGFDHTLYSLHSLRSGRARDLLKLGLSVETIKKVGRWKSNAVFKYLKY